VAVEPALEKQFRLAESGVSRNGGGDAGGTIYGYLFSRATTGCVPHTGMVWGTSSGDRLNDPEDFDFAAVETESP
jgi:hypothetical protein